MRIELDLDSLDIDKLIRLLWPRLQKTLGPWEEVSPGPSFETFWTRLDACGRPTMKIVKEETRHWDGYLKKTQYYWDTLGFDTLEDAQAWVDGNQFEGYHFMEGK